MGDVIGQVRQNWKLWALTVYLILSVLIFVWTGVQFYGINKRLDRIDANVGAVEGIVSATDFNVVAIKKKVAEISSATDRLVLRVK